MDPILAEKPPEERVEPVARPRLAIARPPDRVAGLDPAWVAEWLKQHDPDSFDYWFAPRDPLPFDEWLQGMAMKPATQDLVARVYAVCRQLFDEDPDQLPQCGVALGRNGVAAYFGTLLREDRILRHADLAGEKSADIGKALDDLHGGAWIVRQDFLRPDPALDAAVRRAHEAECVPSPEGACTALADDQTAGSLLHQVRWWSKAKGTKRIYRQKVRWTVQTRERWCAQIVRSLNQYNRGLRILKDRALVEAEQHQYKGKNQTYMRPITYVACGPRREPAAAECVPEKTPRRVGEQTPRYVLEQTPGCVQEHTLSIRDPDSEIPTQRSRTEIARLAPLPREYSRPSAFPEKREHRQPEFSGKNSEPPHCAAPPARASGTNARALETNPRSVRERAENAQLRHQEEQELARQAWASLPEEEQMFVEQEDGEW